MKSKSSYLNSLKLITTLILVLFNFSCTHLPYEESKVEIEKINYSVSNLDHTNPEFIKFLRFNGYSNSSLPLKKWGLQELLLAQEFFNKDFKIAKKEWESIQINEKIALLNPPNSIGIVVGKGDNNDEISKNLFGGGFTFTFESANKRIIRHEIAFNETQVALLKYELLNLELRNQLKRKIFDLSKNQNHINILKKELKLKKSILDMLFKRVNLGIASNVDYDFLALELEHVHRNLSSQQFKQKILNSEIANLIGITSEKLNLLPIDLIALEKSMEKITINFLDEQKIETFKTEILTKSITLRKLLADYAISEAKLKYEYAKQYPDFQFSPAYAYEFGNNVWQLGIDTFISAISRNELFISKAIKIRDIEADEIMKYQLYLNNNIGLIKSNHTNLINQYKKAKQINLRKNQLISQLLKRFENGLLDRFDLEKELINLSKFDRQLHDAVYNLIDYGLEAESIFQINIFNTTNTLHEK